MELHIQGVRPFDGSYPFDVAASDFTTREWGWIKRLAGYLPLTVEEGFRGGDPELYAAFAVIALHRAGKIAPADAAEVFARIGDGPFGSTITIRRSAADEEESEAEPVQDPTESWNGKPDDSGPATNPNSGSTENPPVYGMPDLATSVSPKQGSGT